MPDLPDTSQEFTVDPDLCTGCNDCVKALPQHFRDTGEDTAEVISCAGVDRAKVEAVMKACPGKAIKWR
ncbi:MAG: ferredoxin [Deltaproteobacteria bacterium]|nr:ferredoxin [Deltaproteobacteria bacterium]